MKCSNCQEPLLEGDQFCANCGQPVTVPASPPAAQSVAPAARKRMPRWLLVVIILAILILFCCVGVWLWYSWLWY